MLKTYDAIRFIKVLESGRTKPLLLECELSDDSGSMEGTFVVKARGLPEVDDYGLFAETLGYLVAQELGINTPQAAFVMISKEFAGVINPVLKRSGLMVTEGLGFGSEHQGTGVIAASADTRLGSEQIPTALEIFCYDLLIQNPDRLPANPNCLVKAGRLVAFDFNTCFSFLLLIGTANEPWEFSKHQIAERHLFYRTLRNKELDFKPFIDRLAAISSERLDEILQAIPFGDGKWDEKIKEHFYSIRDNISKLEIEIARCLL